MEVSTPSFSKCSVSRSRRKGPMSRSLVLPDASFGPRSRLQQVLPGALGDHHDRVAALGHPLADVLQQAVRAVEREGHLGDQHDVRVAVGERGVAGDEAGVPAHQPDQPDAVRRRLRLHPRGPDRVAGQAERRLEAEALVDQRDVVVDGLGDADHGDPQAPLADHPHDLHGAAHRAVAADDEQHVDVEPLEAVDDLLGVLVAARGAEHGAAVDGDVAHRLAGSARSTSWP